MEKNQYIPVMIQSLKKKSEILDTIMELNIRQSEELENPALDPDDFDKTVEEKSKQIEQLDLLDDGFQELFDRVKDDLKNHQDIYRDEIAQMQDYIRKKIQSILSKLQKHLSHISTSSLQDKTTRTTLTSKKLLRCSKQMKQQ